VTLPAHHERNPGRGRRGAEPRNRSKVAVTAERPPPEASQHSDLSLEGRLPRGSIEGDEPPIPRGLEDPVSVGGEGEYPF